MLPATAITASLLAFIYLKLSIAIIKLRHANRVRLGDGGLELLENAIRAHGNFAEYTPFFLILLAVFELNGGFKWLVMLLGLIFIAGRLLHVKGINYHDKHLSKRILGMKITFQLILFLAAANILLVAIHLLKSYQLI